MVNPILAAAVGRVTIEKGVELAADLLEGIARRQVAVNLLQTDIADALAAGLKDIPESSVEAAREYATKRGDRLKEKLAAESEG